VVSRGRRGRLRRGDYATELQKDLRPLKRPNVLVLMWRWRWELMLGLGVPAEIAVLIAAVGGGWTLAILGTVIVTLTAWPAARRWLIAHARCIVVAHRIRTGCAQAWIQTRYGRLPIIVLTTPQSYGERVYVWCPAGVRLADFQGARDVLRSACWATDVRVTPSSRYSHIVTLDVVRYEHAE
jgi:hypothetical protein